MATKEELKAEIEKLYQEMKSEDKKEDLKHKSLGYKYKLIYWIHPIEGGDDYKMISYTRIKPSKETIKYLLRNSEVKNDYAVVEL